MTTKLFTAVMGTALLALAGCQSTQDKTPADTLVATFTSAAPNLAAGASDPVWAQRQAVVGRADGWRQLRRQARATRANPPSP
jgi:predicted component of type VI protein secretion system